MHLTVLLYVPPPLPVCLHVVRPMTFDSKVGPCDDTLELWKWFSYGVSAISWRCEGDQERRRQCVPQGSWAQISFHFPHISVAFQLTWLFVQIFVYGL